MYAQIYARMQVWMDRRIPVCRERTGGLGEKQGEKERMRRKETERERE